MNLLRALDGVMVDNRKTIDLNGIKILVDWTPEGYLSKIVDREGTPLSSLIRGFKTKGELDKFLKDRFGVRVDNTFTPFISGLPIPRFKEAYVNQWERI